MNILTVDIGGTNIKVLVSGQSMRRKFPSGPKMTPGEMVKKVREITTDWDYDVVSIGYPGRVHEGKIVCEPRNLAPGWIGFDFEAEFGRPVKLINDAAMQALGSYRGGTMLFLGLGTGLGSAIVVPGGVVPLELGQLIYGESTYEDYAGVRGLKRFGKKKWTKFVANGVAHLIDTIHTDEVVIGGGNASKLKSIPLGCRIGDNANAFTGGFRLWEDADALHEPARAQAPNRARAQNRYKGRRDEDRRRH